MPNRMVPVSSAVTLIAARAVSSAAARVRSAYGRISSAEAVGTTPRPTRVNSGPPTLRSRLRICSETDGWL